MSCWPAWAASRVRTVQFSTPSSPHPPHPPIPPPPTQPPRSLHVDEASAAPPVKGPSFRTEACERSTLVVKRCRESGEDVGKWWGWRKAGRRGDEFTFQERSQHWDRQWSSVWMVRTEAHRRASPMKLSILQCRGFLKWHLHWQCVDSVVGTGDFHHCKNRLVPWGGNNSRTISLMPVLWGWIGIKTGLPV